VAGIALDFSTVTPMNTPRALTKSSLPPRIQFEVNTSQKLYFGAVHYPENWPQERSAQEIRLMQVTRLGFQNAQFLGD
jgi:hypothetical protein